ncbi:ATP-binding cassette domain-containing protein [uncultured Sunxiuqinia sp.]|uniref:ATP-binding cassette domain-containing protein n=1 Tax=uncultured Sunxiuqinia sp. TaxID=1573825 RepID=UPI0030DDA846|tara:strand:+ start:231 stop:3296 length:3066 start_codon:yes stop_codon:yes gene_type:complete
MNEITLNALINLFALFSAISESKKEEAIRNFSLYLHEHFGIADSKEYLNLFEELLDLYGVDGSPAIPLDMVQEARNISTNIRGWLRKEEQIMVFLRFLELVKNGNIAKAEGLFETLANVFEISKAEVNKFFAFIFYPSTQEIDASDFLLINRNEKPGKHRYRHIYEKNIDGELLFLRCRSIGHHIFVFHGNEYLTIEGNPVIPGRFYAFKEGSIIRGPRIAPVYYTDISSGFIDEDLSPSFVFSAEEIEFKFKNSNNGLHRFSFAEKSGQLIAIMGGSGVGKSTLLNILNGNIPVRQGRVKINQVDIYDHKKAIEGLIGYVPQDDLLFEDLTVWENLYYNATLCFDQLSPSAIGEKVDKVLHELELNAFKDLKVGSPLKKVISGGQRKRLNVALELIREPAILFVDEPTSGLSSTDSEKVMLLLKQQARKGKLIIVNIHQPSSAIFKLFDKLWILDSGGRPIYTGNPLDAIIYFKREVNHVNAEVCECLLCGNVNPEQVLEIVETKKIDNSGNFLPERRFTPQYWYDEYRKKSKLLRAKMPRPEAGLPPAGSRKPGLTKQFRIFFERNLRIKTADRQYLIINLLEAPVLALIVAWFTRFSEGNDYIFFENKSMISYLFMAIVVILFMGMSVSAEEIIKDRKIVQRESFLNLSRFSYLNSKILFLVVLSAFQSFSFVLIGNLILGIHGMTLAYWIVLFSVAVFANLLGLNISAAFNSVVAIYILVPLLLIPQILLCGIIVKFDDLQDKTAAKDAVPIAGEIMASRWAFEALAVEQFKENRYMARFFEMEKQMARARFRSEILTTQLIGQLDLVDGWIRLNNPAEETSRKLTIIKNEIEELDDEKVQPPFQHTESLTAGKFNSEIAGFAKSHLNQLKDFHSNRNQEIKGKKDQLIRQLEKENGKQFLYNQKMKYHNQSLETLVLNSEANEIYRETPHGYMQKVAPIYKEPDFNNGRAHFLASHKNLFGYPVDTFVFNLGMIWLMISILYIALYYNWLRKMLEFSVQVKKRRPKGVVQEKASDK